MSQHTFVGLFVLHTEYDSAVVRKKSKSLSETQTSNSYFKYFE